MPKNSTDEWDIDANLNTDVGGVGIAQSNVGANIGYGLRESMAQVREKAIALSYPVTGGAANAQTLTIAQSVTSYIDGTVFTFEASATNTGAMTLNINGAGAKAVRKIANAADISLAAGDINVGHRYTVNYDSAANSAAGAFIIVGGDVFESINIVASAPVISMTDTDTGVDHALNGDSASGNFRIQVDKNNEGSAPQFTVDVGSQTTAFRVDENGDLRCMGAMYAGGLTAALDFSSDNSPGNWLGDASGDASGMSRNGIALEMKRTSDGITQRFWRSTNNVGNVSVTTTACTFNNTSDYRRKTDVQPVTGFWDRIAAVAPVSFVWDVGVPDRGFLAHEFAEPYPNSVQGEKDGMDPDSPGRPLYQSMQASTSEVMADVFAALQDIQARLIALEGA